MCEKPASVLEKTPTDCNYATNPSVCVCLQAVRLLKKGGVLVYSTCTVTLAENEEQVAWALDTFPCLTLQPQVRRKKRKKDLRPVGQNHKGFFSFLGASPRCRGPAGGRAATRAAPPPPEIQS